jgi:hypothetical protein
LPDPDNRVTINPDGQIALKFQETNLEGHKRLTAKLKAMLGDIGCHDRLMHRSLYLGKHSDRRHRAPGRNRSVRPRSEDIGAGCELQGARSG